MTICGFVGPTHRFIPLVLDGPALAASTQPLLQQNSLVSDFHLAFKTDILESSTVAAPFTKSFMFGDIHKIYIYMTYIYKKDCPSIG